MRLKIGARTDPMSLLRDFTFERKIIVETEEQFIFGELSYPKKVRTNFLKFGSGKKGRPIEYYTLETVLFFSTKMFIEHPIYVQHAAAENIPPVHVYDRRILREYLFGEIQQGECDRFDKRAPSKIPTKVEPVIYDGKSPSILDLMKGALLLYKVKDQPALKESNLKKPRIEDTLAVEKVQKQPKARLPPAPSKEPAVVIKGNKMTSAALDCRAKSSDHDENVIPLRRFGFLKDVKLKSIDSSGQVVDVEEPAIKDKKSFQVPFAENQPKLMVPFGTNSTADAPRNTNDPNTTATCFNKPTNTVTYVESLTPTSDGTVVSLIPIVYAPVPTNNVNTDTDDDHLTDEVKQMKNNILQMDQNMHALKTQMDEFSKGFQICKDKHKAMQTEMETLKRKLSTLESRLHLQSKKRRRSP